MKTMNPSLTPSMLHPDGGGESAGSSLLKPQSQRSCNRNRIPSLIHSKCSCSLPDKDDRRVSWRCLLFVPVQVSWRGSLNQVTRGWSPVVWVTSMLLVPIIL